MCLLNLHVAVWIVAVATRTRPNFQIGLFLAICAAVYAAQFLNAYGARHWRALGLTQNYFDDRGVFISFLYSLPLLSAAGFQMVRARPPPRGVRVPRRSAVCVCPVVTAHSPPRLRFAPARLVQLYAFFTSSSLLIKVKRAELRTQRRSQQQPAAAGGGTEAPLAAPAGDAKKDR